MRKANGFVKRFVTKATLEQFVEETAVVIEAMGARTYRFESWRRVQLPVLATELGKKFPQYQFVFVDKRGESPQLVVTEKPE